MEKIQWKKTIATNEIESIILKINEEDVHFDFVYRNVLSLEKRSLITSQTKIQVICYQTFITFNNVQILREELYPTLRLRRVMVRILRCLESDFKIDKDNISEQECYDKFQKFYRWMICLINGNQEEKFFIAMIKSLVSYATIKEHEYSMEYALHTYPQQVKFQPLSSQHLFFKKTQLHKKYNN